VERTEIRLRGHFDDPESLTDMRLHEINHLAELIRRQFAARERSSRPMHAMIRQ
jgi:hypothetical protein